MDMTEAATREAWRGAIFKRLAKGPAPSGELATLCGEHGNDHFYRWLRNQKYFPRAGKTVGASGQVNLVFAAPAVPRSR